MRRVARCAGCGQALYDTDDYFHLDLYEPGGAHPRPRGTRDLCLECWFSETHPAQRRALYRRSALRA